MIQQLSKVIKIQYVQNRQDVESYLDIKKLVGDTVLTLSGGYQSAGEIRLNNGMTVKKGFYVVLDQGDLKVMNPEDFKLHYDPLSESPWERIKRQNHLLLGVINRLLGELEMFWRASVMARGGKVDDVRWNKVQKEMDNVRRVVGNVEQEKQE